VKLEDAIDPWLNVPKFIIPSDFNLETDIVTFDFKNNN